MSIKLKHSGGNSVSLNPPTSAPTSSEVAFKLPTSDGSAGQVLTTDGSGNLSWVSQPTGGLTMADQWRLSSSKDDSYGTAQVTANWERNDNNFSVVGTGMTQSNGTFTFPATGIYLIRAVVWMRGKGDDRQHLGLIIKATTNDSSYSEIAEVFDSSGNKHGHNSDACVVAEAMFDVTNVSTHKVQLWHNTVGNADMMAQNNAQCTGMTFLKLGET